MAKDPCQEALSTIKELKPHVSQILELLNIHEKEMYFNFLRYKQGEEDYNKLGEFKKVKNLIEYLLTIDEDNNYSK
tara:strand:- start:900 stop:1127 length:228 start_codon:yes stop_codon:yes gene_type:complete